MTQLDPRIQSALERSRPSHSPPAGYEDAMLAQFHTRLGGLADGGDGGVGTAGSSYTTGAQLIYGLKIVAAIVGLTSTGLGGLWLVGKALRTAEVSDQVNVEASVDERVDTGPELEVEPPTNAEASPIDVETTPRLEATEYVPLRPPSPRRTGRPSQTPKGSPTTLAAELQLIRAARIAPPLQALELIESHAEQFPDGELTNERESLRVLALCDLGRLEEARRAREDFVARSPGALLLQRVATGCGDQISLPTTESQPTGNRSP